MARKKKQTKFRVKVIKEPKKRPKLTPKAALQMRRDNRSGLKGAREYRESYEKAYGDYNRKDLAGKITYKEAEAAADWGHPTVKKAQREMESRLRRAHKKRVNARPKAKRGRR